MDTTTKGSARLVRSQEKTLNEWAKEVHELAKEKGWWDSDRDFGGLIALVHTELSESHEAWRHNLPIYYTEEGKPEGWGIELVDALIRILDILAYNGVDIDDYMTIKNSYNKTRSYRHGGLRA